MAFDTGFIEVGQTGDTFRDGVAGVHVVAIATAHLTVHHWVSTGEIELAALFQVTLEASLGRFAGIDDRARATTFIDVNRTGAVTGFATDFFRIAAGCDQLCVRRGVEI